MSKADIRVSKNLQKIANRLDRELEKAAGQRMGFSLVVFSSSEDGETNYVSNCARSESASSLKRLLAYWEHKGVLDIPAHHKN